jgi:hypothetical protein
MLKSSDFGVILRKMRLMKGKTCSGGIEKNSVVTDHSIREYV